MKYVRIKVSVMIGTLFLSILLLAGQCAPVPEVFGINSFTATPQTHLAGGGEVTLAWDVKSADTISIDQGIGVVTGTSKKVTVTSDTIFTLTASKGSQKVMATASVNVDPRPSNSITVTIIGLSSVSADVTVTGPNSFNQKLTATKTFPDLQPGSYTVVAKEIPSGADKYVVDKPSQVVELKVGESLSATVTYTLLQAVLYVNAEIGADSNEGSSDKPFKTITKALDKAVAGQKVLLMSMENIRAYSTSTGESFPLRVKSGVTLEGESSPTVIGGSGSCIELDDVQDVKLAKLGLQCDISILLRNAKNISIEQLNSASKNNGINVQNSSVTLQSVNIYNSTQEGLWILGSSQVILTDSKLFQNGFGVHLSDTANLTVDNSSFYENTSSGIFVQDTTSLTLKNSHADNNGNPTSVGDGLSVNSTGDGTITIDNTTFNNNWSGINLHCGFAGINLFDLTVTNSIFSENRTYGICVGDAEGVIELRTNLFSSNKVYQISDQRPGNIKKVIFAPETILSDGTITKQPSGLQTGPDRDATFWEIIGANNYICFDTSCTIP